MKGAEPRRIARTTPPVVVLTIAGSDSGGGAGIQADLATFAAFDVFGTSAVTALTAQDTMAVHGITLVDPDVVASQIDVVLGDLPVNAAKTGMLGQPGTVARVGERAAGGRLVNLVVDPVLVTTSGDELCSDQAAMVDAYRRHLLPYAAVVTPNVAEASALTGVAIGVAERRGAVDAMVDAMVDAGRTLVALGTTVAIVTGGHAGGTRAPDVVVGPDDAVTVLDGERVVTKNDHGTGCTFSAALAAGLAQGLSALHAARQAKAYVGDALRSGASWHLGHGRGPVDHRAWVHGAPRNPI